MAVQKTILKRYSGTAWDEIYLKGVADIVEIGKEISLSSAVAGYETTATIAATDSVQAVIEKLAYPLVQLDKVTVPAIQGNVTTMQGDITNLKSGEAITSIAASKVTGVLSIDNIPASALERVVTVANDTARLALTTASIQTGDVCKVTDTNKMYFVVNDSQLSTEDGWMEFTAGAAASVAWTGITGKPTTVAESGLTDAVADSDCATTGANKVLMTNGDGKIEVDTTGTAANATHATSADTAATATSVAFTGITGISVNASQIEDAVAKVHTHSNKTVLDALTDNTGTLQYNGAAIATQTWVEENYSSTIALVDADPAEDMVEGDLCLVKIS